MSTDIARIRREYSKNALNKNTVEKNPIAQFNKWFEEALNSGIEDANAMTLATATKDGRPSARIVLIKELNSQGFVFYTNYQSRKGLEIDQNPFGCINFYWKELERQVRADGYIEKISREKSDEYFKTRPRGSQIGAWTSPQSNKIANREIMEERFRRLEEKYKDKEIPRPAQWGGYVLIPDMMEFWQGRPNRLHDRILYTIQKDGNWMIDRISP